MTGPAATWNGRPAAIAALVCMVLACPPAQAQASVVAQGNASQADVKSITDKILSRWTVGLDSAEPVAVKFVVNSDGELSGELEVVDGQFRYGPEHQKFRSSAELAVRAIKRAAPFRLTSPGTARWEQVITMTFDPALAMRQ